MLLQTSLGESNKRYRRTHRYRNSPPFPYPVAHERAQGCLPHSLVGIGSVSTPDECGAPGKQPFDRGCSSCHRVVRRRYRKPGRCPYLSSSAAPACKGHLCHLRAGPIGRRGMPAYRAPGRLHSYIQRQDKLFSPHRVGPYCSTSVPCERRLTETPVFRQATRGSRLRHSSPEHEPLRRQKMGRLPIRLALLPPYASPVEGSLTTRMPQDTRRGRSDPTEAPLLLRHAKPG